MMAETTADIPMQSIEQVLAAVAKWPLAQRRELIAAVALSIVADFPPPRQMRPMEELIGLGAGDGPPPDDETVARWKDEHLRKKYG